MSWKMRAWLINYQARIRAKLFRRGFDYAAGELLRSNGVSREWEAHQHPDFQNDFDAGIKAAVVAYEMLSRPTAQPFQRRHICNHPDHKE